MRNHYPLRLAGAAALALAVSLALSGPASAFSGLSDKQKAHIDEFVHCKILLLTDLDAFEADPACGGPVAIDLKSMVPTGNGNAVKEEDEEEEECDYEYESETLYMREKPICEIPA